MRRKSERTASKKAKPSPDKKSVEKEKSKRTRTSRRRKQSSSSEESADEASPVREAEAIPAEPEKKPPQTPTKEKEVSPEDAHEVWHVKTAEVPSDTGEIQKLKICLTRPPSTPERVDRSPRSRRKHSRATSSSDTPSVEAVEDRKKSKHRSKRAARESKDESERHIDSQGDEADSETLSDAKAKKTQSLEAASDTVPDETPMSTTSEDKTVELKKPAAAEQNKESGIEGKTSDADTTVASPQAEIKGNQSKEIKQPQPDDSSSSRNESKEKSQESQDSQKQSEKKETTESTETEPEKEEPQNQSHRSQEKEEAASEPEVSKSEDSSNNSKTEEAESSQNESSKAINDNDVVDSSEIVEKQQRQIVSPEPRQGSRVERTTEKNRHTELERSDSTHSAQEEPLHNGQAAPIVVSRKRRWGSRPSKLTTQKSITISTDVLKDIIPDVKPVEFEEVIEEKKQHKRVQSNDKIERPVLPKIVIDNTEHMEKHKKEYEEREPENLKFREPLSANRRISIVKDDSIIARPPSPPRNKQSCILYITNLVRPFTLPQLKNLLQRTGRISEDGFWIDKIKSKCFVRYETEDQAVETRHALHGVTWPVSNPKTLQVDFSSQDAFDKAKANEDTDNAQATTIPGTVEDWLREQDMKRERGELDKPWERKAAAVREWDFGKNEKDKDKERPKREERIIDKRRHRTPERSPEPAKKFKKKEEEAPAKLLDDLFRKTKTTPCIYWLPLSAEMIAIKEEQRRQHMAEHERRLQELRRSSHRRH